MFILDHPYQFFGALFILTLAAGAWLGSRFSRWRIARLKTRIELLKLGL